VSGESRTLRSDYMRFAKRETGLAYNLASSGIADCALGDLGVSVADLELHGPNAYGWPPLVEVIARRFGAEPECVVTAAGASFANHLALAALLEPGDEVLVEDPTYELLTSTLGYLQAKVRRFERRREEDWALDADEVAARLAPSTRHEIADAAARVGARVLVDEVYLELMFEGGRTRTAFRGDADIVVTSSLTKAYGLSGLRCGWILASPQLAGRMRALNDLYAVVPPHVAERLSLLAFDRLGELRARASGMLETNRAAYRQLLGGHPRLDQVVFDQGTTVFPRLRSGDGDGLSELLRSRFETSVVPGRFFGRPDHIRVGLGWGTAKTRTGLERLAAALDR